MIALLCSLLLLGPALPQEEERIPPDPALVESTRAAMKKALAGSDPVALVEAIAAAADVLHEDVIELVAKGLRREEEPVREAALSALRYMDHPEALDALHAIYARDEELRRHPELGVLLLKAIGQHASPSSIRVLSDDPFSAPSEEAVKARIFALGRIRDPRAVEALLAMMQKAGPRSGRGTGPYMSHFRVALMVLTGTDQGTSRELWVRWWNDNKKGYVLPERVPELPQRMRDAWSYYWGLGRFEERRERREDRGDDAVRRERGAESSAESSTEIGLRTSGRP